jgi:nucleotide-binding universal stress UspA family protein
MAGDARSPVVVAFDGSPESEAALRAAVELLGAHRLVIVSVWEPGLALAMAPLRDPTGIGYASPSAEEMVAVDRAQHDHALEAVEVGARLARELGAEAETYPVADEADIAGTIAAVAERRDACAVVVGSRGLGTVKSKLLGSTSRELLHRLGCPVLVVKAPRRT